MSDPRPSKRFSFYAFDLDRHHTKMSTDAAGDERTEVMVMLNEEGHEFTLSLSVAELRELDVFAMLNEAAQRSNRDAG